MLSPLYSVFVERYYDSLYNNITECLILSRYNFVSLCITVFARGSLKSISTNLLISTLLFVLIPQILNLITGLGSMNLYDNNNNSNSKYFLGASNIFEAILACYVIPSSQQHYKLGNTIVRATKETKTQRGSL